MDSDSSEEELLPYNIETASVNPFDYKDPLLVSPLLKAIIQNDYPTAKSYIDKGKHVNVPDNQGNTPLHGLVLQKKDENVFADKEFKKIFQLLINSSYININACNHDRATPLLLSVMECRDEDFIISLIEAGCDVNICNELKQAPLHFAIKRNLIRVANCLIKNGADIHVRDIYMYTALHYAVEENKMEAVCMLLYYAVNVNFANECGLTPFMIAVNDIDKYEIARMLFPFYNNFSQLAYDGYDALLLAANTVNPIVVDLLKAGVNVNTIAADGSSVIFFAICYRTADLFKSLWNIFDHLNLLHTDVPFLIFFTERCCFSSEEWLACINTIFESPFIKCLIDDCVYYSKSINRDECLLGKLFQVLKKREIVLEKRLSIISLFLSHGIEVLPEDVYLAYDNFGFQDEMELLLQCGNHQNGINKFKFPLLPFYLAKEKSYSSEYVFELFKEHLDGATPVIVPAIKFASRFFSMTPDMVSYIVYCPLLNDTEKQALDAVLKYIPTFPSLKELCRNEIRRTINKNIPVKKTYYFHCATNSLNISTVMKDVIRFKKPLYVKEV